MLGLTRVVRRTLTGGIAAVVSAILSACTSTTAFEPASVTPRVSIHRIKFPLTNVYAIGADRVVLVDAGKPGHGEAILEELAAVGFEPDDVSGLLVTHAHRDHAGSAAELRDLLGVPILLHEADVPSARSGMSGPVRPNGPMAFAGWAFVGGRFPAFEPDVLVEEGFDLRAYGIPGCVVHTPGHTPGSVTVVLDSGDAFVGDLLAGSILDARSPRIAFFTGADSAESQRAANETSALSLQRLRNAGVLTIHPGHGGPVQAEEAFERLLPESPGS